MKQLLYMKTIIYLSVIIIILSSCTSGVKGIFAKKTDREKYAEKIEKLNPPKGKSWKNAGELALLNPLITAVPYSETGSLHGDSADVAAFRFPVKAGQKIIVELSALTKPFTAYTELWEIRNNGERKLLSSADTLLNFIEHSSPEAGNYLVRMQPQLGTTGSFKFSIILSPLLGYPIEPGIKSNIGSIWGDDRDAGVRKHEGIDIFAKKGSYIVAVTDGTVSRLGDGGIGGKVIWFSPADYNFSVYYAHLDTQLVQSGQRVKKGDFLGTVGNTGNARFTPAHLHFGIYTGYGAIDPLAFIQEIRSPKESILSDKLNQWYKGSAKLKLYPSPEKKNAYSLNESINMKLQSYTADFYRVIFPDGKRAFVSDDDINKKMKL